METIECEDLKGKLDRGDDFKLVMTMGTWAYEAKHIPGSISVSSNEEALKLLKPEDEIVVYCSMAECISSQNAYHMLVKNGYTKVCRYSGGLARWEERGYPLEGSMVE
jgi:rhodanese-related sulfurtransferase